MGKKNGRIGDNGNVQNVRNTRNSRNNRNQESMEMVLDKNFITPAPKITNKKIRIKCKNKHQQEFIDIIDNNQIILCSGPAGCGKSHLSIAKALEYIQTPNNGYDILYIITPAVEVEEKLGSLPGSLDMKLEPFLFSTYYLIDKLIGKETREKMVEDHIIQPLALGFLRGVNIDNSVLVFEEAQNASHKQMKTLLTRIGFNAKFIISGDIKQIDRFRNTEESGLLDAMERFKDFDEIGQFNFEDGDSVRNDIINRLLKFY